MVRMSEVMEKPVFDIEMKPYVVRAGDQRVVVKLAEAPKKSDFLVVGGNVYRVNSVQGPTLMCQKLNGNKNAVVVAELK